MYVKAVEGNERWDQRRKKNTKLELDGLKRKNEGEKKRETKEGEKKREKKEGEKKREKKRGR